MRTILLILAMIAIPVTASEWTGKVVSMEVVLPSPVVLFQLSGELEDTPRCNKRQSYALDTSMPGGGITFELLKSALESGRTVSAKGLNTCTVHGKAEAVKSVKIL